MRERVSSTSIPLGSACVLLNPIQESSRLRIPLYSRTQNTVGFLTITTWALEAEDRGSSTEHTPCRVPQHNTQVNIVIVEIYKMVLNTINHYYFFIFQIYYIYNFLFQLLINNKKDIIKVFLFKIKIYILIVFNRYIN